MNIKISNILLSITGILAIKTSLNRFIIGKSLTGENHSDKVRLKYRFFEPGSLTDSPLLVILHGADGRGSDNMKQLNYATISCIKEIKKKYSPLILLPQCPSDNVWTINPKNPFNNFNLDSIPVSPTLEIVRDIILKLVDEYRIDTNRIYIIGSSMGGTGTWEMILRNHGLFAAAIAVCAASDPSKVALVKDIHIWAFSGGKDKYYDYRETEETVEKLKKFNGEIKYTLYKDQGHNIGELVFKDPEVIDWLFAQRKKEINNTESKN
jgi:predicted peptidase